MPPRNQVLVSLHQGSLYALLGVWDKTAKNLLLDNANQSKNSKLQRMPKIQTRQTKAPEGFEEIQPKLKEFQKEMREAENEPTDGKAKHEVTWPLTR